MDDRRSRDAAEEPLSDRALDRELAAAFDVDPSPEFLARVRLRVANEPVPSGWTTQRWNWSGWAVTAAVAAMLAVAVYSVWPRTDAVQPREAVAPRPAIDRGPVPRVVREQSTPTRDDNTAAPTGVTRGSSRRANRPSVDLAPAITRAEPRSDGPADRSAGLDGPPADAPKLSEVLISPDEVRAFERVLATVQGRRVVPEPEPQAARQASAADAVNTDAVKLPDIEITPVIIEPLPQLARLEGVRQ